MELAIDTATERASLAIAQRGVTIAALSWPCAQDQSRQLIPALEHLLEMAKVGKGDLTGLVVVTGPGSYNSLRVGLSTAKGLALGLGLPLVGVPTLEAEAYAYALTRRPVCPVLRFGRDQVVWAAYQLTDQGWARLRAEQVSTIDELLAQVERQSVFCGPAAPMLSAQCPDFVGTLRPEAACRAALAVELGWQHLKDGHSDDPATLQPLYLRPPAITMPKPSPQRKDD